jgi:hypothetical protein
VSIAHLHSHPIRPQLEIPLPADLPFPTKALLGVAHMRIEDLLGKGELGARRQHPADILEGLEEAGVRGRNGRAVLDGEGGRCGEAPSRSGER